MPVLDIVKTASFSYPINTKYPNTFACSGIQTGLLVAYASGNDIIVLVEGKYITAVLKGHQHEVCAIAFEAHGPYIVSADVENNVMHWHFQDLSYWQTGRSIKLNFDVICLAWYASRSKICVSSKKGLFLSSSNDFEKSCERLCQSSSFCAFNFDGSLLASHDHKRTVTVFTFVGRNQMLTQVVRHPVNIEVMEFHPSLPAFLTITRDMVLRIWRQSVLGTFACTSSVKVPVVGRFVRPVSLANEKRQVCGPEKPVKIGFVLSDEKRIYRDVDENGRMDTSSMVEVRNAPNKANMKLHAIIETNLGIEAILTSENGITIVAEETTRGKDAVPERRDFVIHNGKITSACFSPDSLWMYSLDENGWLILWSIFNPYAVSAILAKHVEAATWVHEKALLFCKKGHVYQFDITRKVESEYDFPELSNCRKLYYLGGEVMAVTDSEIVFKERRLSLGEYRSISISREFEGHSLAVVLGKSDELSAFLLPSFERVECVPRTGPVVGAEALTVNSFAVATSSDLELWFFLTDKFVMIHKVPLPGIRGLYPDSSEFCGRIIAFDDKHLFEVENGVKCVLRSENITYVLTSPCGHYAVFHGNSFEIYPSWCVKDPPTSHRRVLDSALTVKTMTADDKFLMAVSKPSNRNFMIAPRMFLALGEEVSQEVEATLFHLLEFSALGNLESCKALQVPAIPNQYPISDAMVLPASYSRPAYLDLYKKLKDISEDVDLFGLRYLLAVNETVWPPSFFALWLAFSFKQSQIVEYLMKTIDANSLSKFYIPVGIKLHALLVKVVRAALSNMWASIQKIEPVAILHAALDQVSVISKLYNAIGDNQRADFFEKNFKLEKFRKSALRNAYSSLGHHTYEMAVTLFLVAGDLKSAISVILDKLNDPLLAFLVVRLRTKSNYESEEMKWFLNTVKWSDDICPFLISHLMDSEEATNLLRDRILETETARNISSFGDRRIALFEIYYYLTKKTDIVGELAMNLAFDGMSPLAEYLFSFVSSPYSVIRAAGENTSELPQIEDDKESSSDEERIMVSKNEAFNFGGWDTEIDNDDDDWSDSDDSEQSDSEPKEPQKESTPVETEQKSPVQELINRFTKEQLSSLSYFFGLSKRNDISGKLALHFGEVRIAAKLLSDEQMEMLFTQLSLFIDYCSVLFFDSVCMPLTERQLFSLSKLLLELTPGCPENPEMDLKTILSMRNTGYLHSVFCGCFVVAMWTYMHPFLVQILSQKFESVHIEVDKLPPARTFFDVDLQSPRFPDSLPDLLWSYTQAKKDLSLDNDRLLIMICLFGEIVAISKEFHNEKDIDWQTKLLDRWKSLRNTLEFYQVALGCPSLEYPNIEYKDHLTEIIVERHKEKIEEFRAIQKQAIEMLPYPILRNGDIAVKEPNIVRMTPPDGCDDITSLAFMGIDSNSKLVVVSSGKLFKLSLEREREKTLVKVVPTDIPETFTKVIGHPTFNLFAALGQKHTALYNYDNTDKTPCVTYKLSGERPTCAAFSPNGFKIAICTDTIDIFPFDVSQRDASPSISHSMKGRITAVAWVNSDTILVVAYTVNGVSNLAIVDTLAKYDTPLPFKPELGEITAISVESKRSRLVVATDKGYVVICNMKQNYATTTIGPLNKESPSPVVDMASLYDLSVVVTEQEVLALNTSTGGRHNLVDGGHSIRAVAIVDTQIVAVGRSSEMLIWRPT